MVPLIECFGSFLAGFKTTERQAETIPEKSTKHQKFNSFSNPPMGFLMAFLRIDLGKKVKL